MRSHCQKDLQTSLQVNMRYVRPLDRVLNDLDIVDAAASDDSIVEQVKMAEREYLESRSAYLLKGSIVESVLVTDPILKAVHSGVNATPAER